MRVAASVRVSTARQAQQQTIAQQLDRITAFVQAQGSVLSTDQIYRDDGVSGAVLARPGWIASATRWLAVNWAGCSSPPRTGWRAPTCSRWCYWRSSIGLAVRSTSWIGR